MAESIVTFPNIGSSQSSFSFSFDYIAATDIDAFVEGVSVFANNASTGTAVGGNTYTVAFSSGGSKTLTFSPAVPQGSTVRIERNTALTTKAVDFSDGAVLTEVALDSAIDQLFFATQESNDKTNESVKVTADGKFDALSKVIKNVATPVATNDAVTKAYVDLVVGTAADAETARAAAVVAQTAAELAETNAETAETNAETAETNAETAQVAAELAETNAETALASTIVAKDAALVAQTAAETAETNAETAETNAETAETNAETAETNANASAVEAEAWAQKIDGEAQTGEGYSSKAWATGGTGVTDTAGSGASQEWATKTTAQVDGTEYSSKEYAVGTQTRGTTGSSKDWATYTGGTVDGSGYSAKYWADQAASSVANFDDKYYGNYATDAAAEDAHEAAGYPVAVGDLYFNTTSNVVRYCQVAPTGAGAPVGTWADIATQDLSNYATAGFSIAMSIAL